MNKLQIGDTLTCGYRIDANYCNLYVLAYSATARQPYAVWDVDSGGNTRNGRYFGDAISAQKCFAYLCYDWLKASEQENSTEIEALPHSDTESSDAIKLLNGIFKNCKAPNPVDLDCMPKQNGKCPRG